MIIGLDIGGTSVKLGLVDGSGALSRADSFPTPLSDPEALVRGVVQVVDAWRADGSIGEADPVEAVGAATAGRVDSRGRAVTASNLYWRDVPLERMLADALHMPAFVENDAQAALLYEWQHGACRGYQHILYLTLGTGVGGAMILDGRPYRGYSNIGGEVGHIITHAGGLECPCGQRGCFERYASAAALERLAQKSNLTAKQLFDLDSHGDELAASILNEYIDELTAGLQSLARLFAPEVIVLGGGLSNAGQRLLDRLTVPINAYWTHIGSNYIPQIILARSRNDAGILGGAAVAGYALGKDV